MSLPFAHLTRDTDPQTGVPRITLSVDLLAAAAVSACSILVTLGTRALRAR
jgi:hypothetical protein